jgi:hypothetical protein
MFNIAAPNRARVDRLCRPQALATFELPALLTGAGSHLPKHYILGDGWVPSPFRHFAAKYEGAPGWKLSKLACNHDVMMDMPRELAQALMAAA